MPTSDPNAATLSKDTPGATKVSVNNPNAAGTSLAGLTPDTDYTMVVYAVNPNGGYSKISAPVVAKSSPASTDNIFSFELLPSVGGNMDRQEDTAKFGNYGVLVLAAGPTASSDYVGTEQNKNITGGGSSYTYSPEGYFDFKLTQNANGLDKANFMRLINDKNGTYKIHINEDGSSMNGNYPIDVTGKAGTPFAGFMQQFVYGTVGNDVTYAITAQDTDTTNSGVTGEDITVKWSTMQNIDHTKTEVYIIRMDNITSHNPVDGTKKGESEPIPGTITKNGDVFEFVGLNTVTKTSNTSASLAHGTYTVYVKNFDAAGNELEVISVLIHPRNES